MARWTVAILFFLTLNRGNCQELVANGSLDERNICTEFQALCAPEAWFFLPSYAVLAKTEDSINYHEAIAFANLYGGYWSANYLYTKLLCRLEAGKEYKLSVWVNALQNQFEHLDIWLGADEPKYRSLRDYVNKATFTITPNDIDSSRGWWKKCSYTFTAKGYERFMMMGNLTTNEIDRSKYVPSDKHGNIFYYVDNISLKPTTRSSGCPEYYAVLKQVYAQNKRHPARMPDDASLDQSLVNKTIPEGSRSVAPSAPRKRTVGNTTQLPPMSSRPFAPGHHPTDTLQIPDILFETSSSRINHEFAGLLNGFIKKLRQRSFSGLEIIGHTDDRGTPDYNLKLSLNRAISIRDYLLMRMDIDPQTIFVTGLGDTRPIAENDTDEGREKNRRVEIVVRY